MITYTRDMLDELRGLAQTTLYCLFDTKFAKAFLAFAIISTGSILTLKTVGGYLDAKPPTISVITPKSMADIEGKDVYVQGRVRPFESKVTINGTEVYLNGDGTFSQVIPLMMGKNILKIEAQYYGKKSSMVQIATRQLSPEEKEQDAIAKQKEEQTVKEQAEKLAKSKESLAKEQEEVLSAQNENQASPSAVPAQGDNSMIVSKQEIKLNGQTVIKGVFQNTTEKTLRWVKITAQLKDSNNQIVERVEGYVTKLDQHLAPGAKVEYTLPPTSKTYTEAELDVTYEMI